MLCFGDARHVVMQSLSSLPRWRWPARVAVAHRTRRALGRRAVRAVASQLRVTQDVGSAPGARHVRVRASPRRARATATEAARSPLPGRSARHERCAERGRVKARKDNHEPE